MATGNAVYETTFDQVKNRVYSKLAAAITSGATTLTVTLDDAGLFPDLYPYHLTIEDEIVKVTNRSSNTLTIVRAQQDTTAAAHANKTHIALNITAKSVADLNAAVNTIEQAIVDGFTNIKVLGAADYPIDMSGATVNTGGAEIRLSQGAMLDNTTHDLMRVSVHEGSKTTHYFEVGDPTSTIKGTFVDLNLTQALRFTGSAANIDGEVVFRDKLTVGRPANGVDFILYGVTANYRVMWDANGDTNGRWTFGDNDYGMDVAFRGATSGVQLLWDTSEDTLKLTAGKAAFGGNTDWGTGATGTQITGAGYDWVTQTVGRVNTNLNGTAAAAAYYAMSITANQTSSNSIFGTWTELYVSNSVLLTGADNFAAIWGQFEAGTDVTLSDTGCFTAGVYANVKAGSTLIVPSGHSLNGFRAQLEVAAITNNGTTAAFEALKSGGVDWEYGLLIADATTGISIGAATDGIKLTGSTARGINISGVATQAQLYIGGSAILASGEQAIYINTPSETVATNGIWVTLGSNVTVGDLTGIRSRVTGNAASSGANVRGAYLEAKVGTDKFAAMLEGALIHADYSAIGTGTISGDVRGLTVQISQGTGLTAANLYGILLNIQTRGNESITTDDVGLMIRNQAVGGNGRQMDSAIKIAELNMSGGTKGFDVGLDLTGATYNTSAIKLGGKLDANANNLDNVAIIYGNSTYLRIGDAGTTGHSLASEDDLLITGKLEVDGLAFFDALTTISVASTDGLKIIGDTNYPLDVERTYPASAIVGAATFRLNITDAQMDVNAGVIINFELEDEDNVQNLMGYQGFRREGADNTGKYIVYNRFAGVTQQTISLFNDGVKTTILGQSGDYFRIGNAAATSHSLASDDDLMVTGKLEVDGAVYFDVGALMVAEIASAPADVAGFGQFWVKNDAPNNPYFTDDAGTDKQLAVFDVDNGEMIVISNQTAVIETANTPHAFIGFSTGTVNDFSFVAGITGAITAYANYGGTVAGTVLATCVGHGLVTNDVITIRGTTNYNGIFQITKVTNDTFYFTDGWVADDGASDFEMGDYLLAGIGTAGEYDIEWNESVSEGGGAGSVVLFCPMINVTIQTKASAKRKFANNDVGSVSGGGHITLAVADRIWFTHQSDGTNDLTVNLMDLRLMRLA